MDITTTPAPRIRPAVVQAFDAATWTATVQVTGSVATYLAGVPVAKNLSSQLLTAGARVGVIFFDDSNPSDSVLATVYGAVPPAWVTSGMIVDLTVATGDIADLAITTAKLGDLSATTAKIDNQAVTTGKLADLGVTTAKLADLGVTTGKIADLAVTEGKLATGAVTSAKIADGTIVGADCSANVASGVATYDASGYLKAPSRIYPSGQSSRYLADNGAALITNGWLDATNVNAYDAEGVFLAGAAGAPYSRFMNRIVSTSYMAVTGVNAYPSGSSWYRDDTANAASIFVCHDAPQFLWYTTPAGGSDPLTWALQMQLTTTGLGIGVAPASALHVHAPAASTEVRLLLTDATTGSTSSDGFVVLKAANEEVYLWNYENTGLHFGTNSTEQLTITNAGNVTIAGTLTVNGNQTGATDHVFDDYDDIDLLRKWRRGDKLPFATGDLLNRDRLLRDAIIGIERRLAQLERRN